MTRVAYSANVPTRVEQNARKALEVADYGYVLSGGKVVLEGPTASLRANDAVVHAYLRAQPAPQV